MQEQITPKAVVAAIELETAIIENVIEIKTDETKAQRVTNSPTLPPANSTIIMGIRSRALLRRLQYKAIDLLLERLLLLVQSTDLLLPRVLL